LYTGRPPDPEFCLVIFLSPHDEAAGVVSDEVVAAGVVSDEVVAAGVVSDEVVAAGLVEGAGSGNLDPGGRL
jgi:hypothetical protein